MWIEEVMCRIGKAAYRTHEPMLADVDQIYTNAAKYNTPGNGEHGGPGLLQAIRMSVRMMWMRCSCALCCRAGQYVGRVQLLISPESCALDGVIQYYLRVCRYMHPCLLFDTVLFLKVSKSVDYAACLILTSESLRARRDHEACLALAPPCCIHRDIVQHASILDQSVCGHADIMQHAKTLADSARAEAANHLARLRELEARIVLEPDPPPRPRRVHCKCSSCSCMATLHSCHTCYA